MQHQLSVVNTKLARLGQQYDQVLNDLAQADQRLKLLTRETASDQAAFDTTRQQIARIAAISYEQGGSYSPVALLTSNSPQHVLDQSSILAELSAADNAQINKYLSASRQLLTARQTASQARASILQLRHSLGKRLKKLKALQAQEQSLLSQLTAPQQTVTPGGGNSGGGHHYHGPTGTQADTAVQFAYNQIGCPYVFGGTGPCNSGYDCSGLMQASWGQAGISIPRVSYDQMASLPQVSLHDSAGNFTTANLQPGDILGFSGNSHVGMWLGGGYLIDAPVPGQNVEKIPLSGWYLSSLDGAVRP